MFVSVLFGANSDSVRLGSHQSLVPAHLCTSPIPLAAPVESEETTEASAAAGSGARRKKRRRKRARSDNHPREEGNSSSDEMEKEWERDSDQVGQESPAREQGVSALHARSVVEPGASVDEASALREPQPSLKCRLVCLLVNQFTTHCLKSQTRSWRPRGPETRTPTQTESSQRSET